MVQYNNFVYRIDIFETSSNFMGQIKCKSGPNNMTDLFVCVLAPYFYWPTNKKEIEKLSNRQIYVNVFLNIRIKYKYIYFVNEISCFILNVNDICVYVWLYNTTIDQLRYAQLKICIYILFFWLMFINIISVTTEVTLISSVLRLKPREHRCKSMYITFPHHITKLPLHSYPSQFLFYV